MKNTVKFNTKAELAKALLDGRTFLTTDGDKLYYQEKNLHISSPFLVKYKQGSTDAIERMWVYLLGEDLTELLPEHPHQALIASYQEGQVWQYMGEYDNHWTDCLTLTGKWRKPAWKETSHYRLHPHSDLIQAYENGATIQIKECTNKWYDIPTPYWRENEEYRIKPAQHKHQALMDLAKANPRMRWQYQLESGIAWYNLDASPTWVESNEYRPHPHWQLIIEAEDNPDQKWEVKCPKYNPDFIDAGKQPTFQADCKYRKKQTTEFRYQYIHKTLNGRWQVYANMLTEEEALVKFKGRYYDKTGLTIEVPIE